MRSAERLKIAAVQGDAGEDLVALLTPWILAAGNPYFAWLFGPRAPSVVGSWVRRPSSEVWAGRATVALDGDAALGGYISLASDDLTACRRADALALVSTGQGDERKRLIERLGRARDLFAPVPPDCTYLSKIGVLESARGSGVGRLLLDHFLAAGRDRGSRLFRLDVHEENIPAIRLYASVGFDVVDRTKEPVDGMRYLAMALED